MMGTNMLLWLSVCWIPLLQYVMLGNETKFKKNIAVGVTLPQAGREDGEVQAILHRFRATQLWTCLGLTALAVAGALLPWSLGWSMTGLMVWVDLCILLPYLPYARCNRALRQVKEQRGWVQRSEGRRVTVDLRSAAEPVKELGLGHFLLPTLAALAPALWLLWRGERAFGLAMLVNPATAALCYFLYRYAFRRRSEVVDGNTDLTQALTRLRWQHWRRMSLWMAWYMALVSGCMALSYRWPLLGFAAMAALTVLLLVLVLRQEFSLRRMQEKLTADSGVGEYVDEDDRWIWGLFYYAPDDRRLVVNHRVGGNSTLNLARRSGQILMALAAALLLCMPLSGLWMVQMERTPVTVEVEGQSLVARHMGTHYEVALEDIEAVTLLTQQPQLTRLVGTGMDSVEKGTFSSTQWGTLTTCIDPRTGPWLVLETGEGRYLFGDSRTGTAEQLYRQLAGNGG